MQVLKRKKKNPCIAQGSAAQQDTWKGFRSTAKAGDHHGGDPQCPASLTKLCPGISCWGVTVTGPPYGAVAHASPAPALWHNMLGTVPLTHQSRTEFSASVSGWRC